MIRPVHSQRDLTYRSLSSSFLEELCHVPHSRGSKAFTCLIAIRMSQSCHPKIEAGEFFACITSLRAEHPLSASPASDSTFSVRDAYRGKKSHLRFPLGCSTMMEFAQYHATYPQGYSVLDPDFVVHRSHTENNLLVLTSEAFLAFEGSPVFPEHKLQCTQYPNLSDSRDCLPSLSSSSTSPQGLKQSVSPYLGRSEFT